MSRTYRRKNVPYWYDEDEALCKTPSSWRLGGFYSHCETKEEYKIEVVKFHGDSEVTMEQVPKWYKVLFCRRPFRRKEKVALIKEMKNNFTGEIPFPIVKKDAKYYW